MGTVGLYIPSDQSFALVDTALGRFEPIRTYYALTNCVGTAWATAPRKYRFALQGVEYVVDDVAPSSHQVSSVMTYSSWGTAGTCAGGVSVMTPDLRTVSQVSAASRVMAATLDATIGP